VWTESRSVKKKMMMMMFPSSWGVVPCPCDASSASCCGHR